MECVVILVLSHRHEREEIKDQTEEREREEIKKESHTMI